MKRERKSVPMVRKSNVLALARYRLGLHEQKIMALIISKVRMDEKEFVWYRVSWSDIKRASKGALKSSADIKKACMNLKNKTISIKSGKGERGFGFLAEWDIQPGEYVGFKIASGMKDLLLDLLEDGNFTLYELECALALPSPYAIRMYEILKSHAWRKQPVIIELDVLKMSLDIPLDSATYKGYGNFRNFILEKAKKNLAKYSDIKFSYKPIKHGRKVGAIEFNIKSNKRYQKSIMAEVARKFVRPGDVVLINGERCKVDSSACFYQKQKRSIPIGDLSQMLKAGDISIVQEADK